MPTNTATVNMVLLIAEMAKDTQVRAFDRSIKVTHNLAIVETYKGHDGKDKDSVTYINVIQWFKATEGDSIPEYSKGDTIMVQGKLKTESWEDKATGKRQFMTVIESRNVSPIKTHRRRQEQPDLDTSPRPGRVADKDIPKPGKEDEDSTLPF